MYGDPVVGQVVPELVEKEARALRVEHEVGLVFLLAVHFFGGLRLLAVEFLPWSPRQKTYAAMATAVSFFVAGSFFMNAI